MVRPSEVAPGLWAFTRRSSGLPRPGTRLAIAQRPLAVVYNRPSPAQLRVAANDGPPKNDAGGTTSVPVRASASPTQMLARGSVRVVTSASRNTVVLRPL